MENTTSQDCLRIKLSKCLKIVRLYDWLINSYILDFYVDRHWEKLPRSWQLHLENMPPENLSALLNFNEPAQRQQSDVWPLTLLALHCLLRQLCVPRVQQSNALSLDTTRNPILSHTKLKHVFNKGVKPKKRHEIELMGNICEYSCQQSTVDYVIDFGAGLGHLARVLGYGHGIQVCCLEMQSELNEQANCMDKQFEVFAEKHLPPAKREHFHRPEHITLRLTTDMQPHEFLSIIAKSVNRSDTNIEFGIIGLHPCGDLAVTLMRMFINIPQARFLNFASCCYMKLSTAEKQSNGGLPGYPLSSHLLQQPKLAHLSYEAREISCHAMEMYSERLAEGDYEYLKVHSFRAAAERIIIKHWPDLKHCGLRSVKHVHGMQFEDYFYKAVQGLEASHLHRSELQTTTTQNDLRYWRRIVIFYTLRLMFAPLIESIILYDRALFLKENQIIMADINKHASALEAIRRVGEYVRGPSFDHADLIMVEARLERLEEQWVRFNAIHEEIVGSIAASAIKEIEIERAMGLAEEVYFSTKVKLKRKIEELCPQERAYSIGTGEQQPINVQVNVPYHQHDLRNTWGEFDGNILKWQGFRDRFVQMFTIMISLSWYNNLYTKRIP